MWRRSGLATLASFLCLLVFACSSSKDSGSSILLPGGGKSAQAGGATAATNSGNSSSGGARSTGNNSGGSPGIAIGDTGATAGSAGTRSNGDAPSCADTSQTGKLVPLDIYIMLDSSSSMNEASTGAASKWDAVKQALQSFLQDPKSDGIGVGLQYFPLVDPSVPESCTTDAECGAAGPCFQKFCRNAGPGIFPCATSQDCRATDGSNLGPCAPLTYCWPPPSDATEEIQLCHDASECSGSCVPFNQCSGDSTYACPSAGQSCGSSMGKALGTCRAYSPPSVCLNPSSCDVSSYAMPAVQIAALPAAARAVVASINAHTPRGDTPTAPALSGAIEQAKSYAAAHPDHTVVALLATDGLPTECLDDADPSGMIAVRKAAADGLAGAPAISTFVIGVFGPQDTDARRNLNQIANAGGTDSAFLVDTSGDVSAQFLDALNQIRASRLACEYQLPDPPKGEELDFGKINVDLTTSGTTERLLGVGDLSECDSANGGWYYDVPPTPSASPSKILICPAACERFQRLQQGTIQIALGCQTKVR